jgi:hypothetical protein
MKKLIVCLFVAFCIPMLAQDAKNFNRAFYKEVTFETDDYKAYLVKFYTEKKILRMKLRIFNKTKDYIWVKPAEFVVSIGGETLNAEGAPFTVQPDGDEARFMDVRPVNLSDMRVDAFEIELKGFYKIPAIQENVISVPNMSLPVKNDTPFDVGPFKCTIVDNSVKEKKAIANFHCTYNGDKIGVIDISKAEAELPNGQKLKNSVYAGNSQFLKAEGLIMEKGIEKAMKIDFKANNSGNLEDGISVKWNETFRESKAVPYKVFKIPMQLDLEKSEK